MADLDPQGLSLGTHAASWHEQLGRTTVHEVGHQFDLAHGTGASDSHRVTVDNIMYLHTQLVPTDLFYFHAFDVDAIRNRADPPGMPLPP